MTSTVTEAQRRRYARRVWAEQTIGAVMTQETAHAPLPVHGPLDASVDDYASWSYYAVRAADLRLPHARELAHVCDVIQGRLVGGQR